MVIPPDAFLFNLYQILRLALISFSSLLMVVSICKYMNRFLLSCQSHVDTYRLQTWEGVPETVQDEMADHDVQRSRNVSLVLLGGSSHLVL